MVLHPFRNISNLLNVGPRINVRSWRLWLVVFILTCLFAVTASTINPLPAASAQTGNTSVASKPAVIKAVTTPVTNPALVVINKPKAVTPQQCVVDNSYALPSGLDLSTLPEGLSQVIDPTYHYTVYGNTPSQVEAQVQRCAPNLDASSDLAEFAAETSYNLTAQYYWTADNNGYCHVSSVKVGLHLNMVLPDWQPTAYASNGLNTAWQSYISNLATHENGHVAIDQQHAAQLLAELQAFPATDCSIIEASLKGQVNSTVAALNAANDAYDASTNHGATQGAILP